MIEVIHGNNKELARLTGKSIADVRDQYKSQFDIPDRAQAVLNGKTLTKGMESKIKLEDCDELAFVERNRSRVPLLMTALLLALAITGGVFAYTFTTASSTITLTAATGDFASISSNQTVAGWKPFGKLRGPIGAGNLFNVTPTTGYTGDLMVKVYLSNMDELTKNYSFYMMRIQLQNLAGTAVDSEMITQVLSIENGVVSFYWPSSNFTPGTTYYVKNLGGTYIAFPYSPGLITTYNPIIYAQLLQAG